MRLCKNEVPEKRTGTLGDERPLHDSGAISGLTERDLVDDGIFLNHSSAGNTKPISCCMVVFNHCPATITANSLLHIDHPEGEWQDMYTDHFDTISDQLGSRTCESSDQSRG
jgi:hypothetical protein